MPELPEVETFKRFFEKHAKGQEVSRVLVLDPSLLKDASAQDFIKSLEGNILGSGMRWGKFLFFHLSSDKWLAFHFGMTGDLHWRNSIDAAERYDRILFGLKGGGIIALSSQRKFGFARIVDDAQKYMISKKFGADALNISKQDFIERFRHRKRAIKSALLDQSLIAGIGNLYADECLFQAHVHPKTSVHLLSLNKLGQLHGIIQSVLNIAIENNARYGTFPEGFFILERGKEGHCPRCGKRLTHLKISGRTSYFCPICQPLLS